MDYDTGNYAEAYDQLFFATGLVNDDSSIDISKKDFKGGAALYIIAVTPADPEAPTFNIMKPGAVKVDIKFKEATARTYRAIVMCEFERIYQMDINRHLTIVQ